jgi:asparagine synthase (glutamine-hydrolysing)
MDGIFGWLGDHGTPQDMIKAMAQAARLSPGSRAQEHFTPAFGVATASRFGKAAIHVESDLAVALNGRPKFTDQDLAAIAEQQGPAAALAQGWQRFGEKLPTRVHGNFAFAIVEPQKRSTFLALDRVGAERLCYAKAAGHLVFGTSVQQVAAHPAIGRNIDPQAIYDYLYFHTVPAPRSIYRGIRKLLPGQCLSLHNGRVETAFYWHADYTPAAPDFDALRTEFRGLLDVAVRDADAPATAAFLSGGTDSSTVVGALTAARKAPVDTFSIGFDAEGFDEMEYARCAAERYASRAHEYYLKPADIVTTIPVIARTYDEPFGNASAVPSYFCARNAREAGFDQMFAGDGGDEIFGGNARYAKQGLFERYAQLPAILRKGLIEPLAHLPGLSSRFPLSKLRSYVTQANVGLPLRLESYNFLHRTPLDQIFVRDFIDAVDPSTADAALTEVYQRTASDHYINRMMHLDLKFTLADNDLRKVGTMTEAAGIEVHYPLLDDRLVEFANHLPVNYKVRSQTLRWFFKEALRDLLPEKIINKSKHGFGLPFGPWSNQHAPLGEVVQDSLSDFKRRGWIRADYLDHMLAMQRGPHASYYGVMIWVTMMLERWLQENGH